MILALGLLECLGLHVDRTENARYLNEHLSTQNLVCRLIESDRHSLYSAFRVSNEYSRWQVKVAVLIPFVSSH